MNFKKKIMKAVVFIIVAGLFSFTTVSDLPMGSKIPLADLKMKDVSGKTVSLKELQKKNGLLVMFSCNTCPYVIKNQQRTKDVAAYALERNIGVVLINSNEGLRSSDDSFEGMKQYAKSQGYKWNYVVDDNSVLADAFSANRTPENFLFDGTGSLVYHGAIDDNPADPDNIKRHHLKEAINEMTAGKDVSVKTSRSVGCSIKRVKK